MALKKQTVDDIASIEHLDEPLSVVGIKGWIFLLFAIVLSLFVLIWAVVGTITLSVSGKSVLFDSTNLISVTNRVHSVVKDIKTHIGAHVKKDQIIFELQDGTSQAQLIASPVEGIIKEINVSLGNTVHVNSLLAVIQRPDNPEELKIYGFLPLSSSDNIHPGMEVKCSLNAVDSFVYGMLRGVVTEVMIYPVAASDSIMKKIPSISLREYLVNGRTPSRLVIISPTIDSSTVSGFAWTSKTGPPFSVKSGMVGSIRITQEKISPISYIIPTLRKKP